jgi:group I intron endonuclease
MIASENLNRVCGIYCAIHRDSLMCYVGSSMNIGRRIRTHISQSKGDRLGSFHRAIRNFGANAFDVELIEKCPKEKLYERELFWIIFYKSASAKGFNTVAIPGYNSGHKATPVTLERQSIAAKKLWEKWTPDQKAAMAAKGGAARTGIKQSPETIAKRVAKTTGQKRTGNYRHGQTPETVEKLRAGQNARIAAGLFIKHHTAETKAKLSASKKAAFALKPYPANRKSASKKTTLLQQTFPAITLSNLNILPSCEGQIKPAEANIVGN